jgi:hypothetical protein
MCAYAAHRVPHLAADIVCSAAIRQPDLGWQAQAYVRLLRQNQDALNRDLRERDKSTSRATDERV